MRPLLRAPLPAALLGEAGRDHLAQAQAALSDEQPQAALRALERLHAQLVPALDAYLAARAPAPPSGEPLSCGLGFLLLWPELPDLDVEREEPAALLLHHAAQVVEDGVPPELETAALSWPALAAVLAEQSVPRSRWWRRLLRTAAGVLPDEARLVLQRGGGIVWERVGSGAGADQTDLGEVQAGDRLTLQVPLTLPGRVAVLAAAGDEQHAELEVVLPHSYLEDVPRRAHEVVEVTGEVGASRDLVVIWVPELVPAGFCARVLAQRRLPPEARVRRYRYRVV